MAPSEWGHYRDAVWVAMAEDGSWWWALSAHGYPEYGPYPTKDRMLKDADSWISWRRRDDAGGWYRS